MSQGLQNIHGMNRIPARTIVLMEILFLIAIAISFTSGILFTLFLTVPLLIFVYPEFGLSVALTGSVLSRMLFDHWHIQVPVPVLGLYVLLILAGFVFHMYTRPFELVLPKSRLYVLALLMGLFLFVGLFYSTNREYGVQKVLFYCIYNVPLIFLPALLCQDVERMKNVFYFTFVLGLILGVITSYQAMGIPAYLRFRPSESVNQIWLARSLGFSAIAGLGLMGLTRHRMIRLVLLFILPVFIYPIVRTGSRAPFIGLLLCGLVFYFLQPRQSVLRKSAVSFVMIGLMLIFFFASGSSVTSRISDPSAADVVSTVSRLGAWIQAANDFLSAPFTGIGTGSFLWEFLVLTIVYPHNIILELTVEQGILGFVVIILFLYTSASLGFRNVRRFKVAGTREDIQTAITVFTLFLFALWNAMFSGDVTTNEVLWLSAGLIAVLSRRSENAVSKGVIA